MQYALSIRHEFNNEFVVDGLTPDMLNRAVFDNKGNKVGRVVRVLGTPSELLGVVVLSKKFESEDRRVFIRN
jgi:rRNA processing protein Gar1